MWDFLTFRSFITPDLLIITYYIGAVVMPLLSFAMTLWIKNKISLEIDLGVDRRYRYAFYLSLIGCFICMEIFWRVMFEFMIAYFDMHDALMHTSVR